MALAMTPSASLAPKASRPAEKEEGDRAKLLDDTESPDENEAEDRKKLLDDIGT